jgi:succinyl-diaminopimelate desuccinylase
LPSEKELLKAKSYVHTILRQLISPKEIFMNELEKLLNRIDAKELTELCQQLVRIKSVNPPGDELTIAQYAADYLRQAGLETELVAHGPKRASVLARLKGRGRKPGLLYSAHLDTVPVGAETWLHDPFSGDVADEKVWGRGSADMKGGMAVIMSVARILAQAEVPLQGDLILGLTAGEEVDSLGAMTLAARPNLGPVQAVVVTEPSSNQLFIAEKGALQIEITTHGKTAHGSMPELGRNAVMMMVALLAELDTLPIPCTPHPMLGGFSRSINTIAGGIKVNVIPDQCTAEVDMRTVPGQNHRDILARIEELIAGFRKKNPGFSAGIRILNDRPPIVTSPDDPMVHRFVEMIEQATAKRPTPQGVRYFTDAVAFVPVLKAPMIICGPGQAGLAHQPNEYVEIDKLTESARILTLAAFRLLS